jgi:hypothetical protein
MSLEERDCIEETIEIILSDLEDIQVHLHFLPDVVKKICESLKTTTASRWSHVGRIFGIPAASSEFTSLVCRVQEKFTEEAIRSIHSNSTVKVTKTDQDADFTTERKKLKQEHHDTKGELDRLKQLCTKNQIDTSTRKQKEERKVSDVPSSEAELPTVPPRCQRNRPLPTTRQPVLILSLIHAPSHDVATSARSGSPVAQVVIYSSTINSKTWSLISNLCY